MTPGLLAWHGLCLPFWMPSIQDESVADGCCRSRLLRLASDLDRGDARALLAAVEADEIDHASLGRLEPETYTRFEIVSTEAVLLVLIAWRPGEFSPAHDHGGSSCLFRVLRGVATERRFAFRADGRVRTVEEERFLPGSIVACDGEDIHALGNDADQDEMLITLHVYRPRPKMRTYGVADGVEA